MVGASAAGSERGQRWLLLAAVVLAYGASVLGRYALDDGAVLLLNPLVQRGPAGIAALLSHDTFFGRLGEATARWPGGRYRPLSLVTFALEQAVQHNNPHLSHALNVALFALAVDALYLLLRRHLAPPGSLLPLGASALFALHPIHAEVVANIKGRDELLALLFGLLCLRLSLQAPPRPALAALCALLAMLSKETGLLLLALVPLTLAWVAPSPRAALGALPGLLGAAALYLGARAWALAGPGPAPAPPDLLHDPFLYAGPGQRLPTAVAVLGKDLVKLAAPWPLSWDYGYPQIPYRSWGDPLVLLAALALLALLAAAALGARRRALWAWGALLLLGSLLPVSNLLLPTGVLFAERLLFQPSLGWAVAVVDGALGLAALASPRARAALGWAAAGALLAGGAACAVRCLDWRDTEALVLADVEHAPRSARLRKEAAEILMGRAQGQRDPAARAAGVRAALAQLDQAVALDPRSFGAWVEKGNAHAWLGQVEQASAAWDRAEALWPGQPEVRSARADYLGGTHLKRGLEALAQGQAVGARAELEQAAALRPDDPAAWEGLGRAAMQGGDPRRAAQAFEREVALKPERAEAWFNLGGARLAQGQREAAAEALARALALRPAFPEAARALELARPRPVGP